MADKVQSKMKGRRGVAIKRQSRLFVRRLHDYFTRECDNGGPLIHQRKIKERVSQALQLGTTCVGKIVNNPSTRLKKPRPRPKVYGNLDEPAKAALRNVVFEMYRKHEIPSHGRILQVVKQRKICDASMSTMGRMLKEVGFFQNKRFLVEKRNIALARCKFYRKVNAIDFEKAVFVGETWVSADLSKNVADESFQRSQTRSFKELKQTKHVLALHAGTSKGFVKDSLRVFQASKQDAYERELSSKHYNDWFMTMMENIEPGSTIIIANRPNNTTQINKPPSFSSPKKEMIDWLTERNIEFAKDAFRVQLLALIKKNKPEKRYELDELAAEFGHSIIRLPPFGCNFNAINVVWTQVKEKIAQRNDVFTLNSVEQLFSEAISEVTEEDWRSAVLKTKNVVEDAERGDYEIDDVMDELLEEFMNPDIINISDSESSDESDSDDSIVMDYSM